MPKCGYQMFKNNFYDQTCMNVPFQGQNLHGLDENIPSWMLYWKKGRRMKMPEIWKYSVVGILSVKVATPSVP